jgi:uncharacterized protein YbcI
MPEADGTPGMTPMQSFENAEWRTNPLQEISHEMVQIYKDQFGRGPTKVSTRYAGPDTVVCLLEHTLTPAERNLQAMGEHQRLRDIRLFFQYAEKSRFLEPVERLTGRRVRAFISGIDTNADIATEMFVLDPQSRESSSDELTPSSEA